MELSLWVTELPADAANYHPLSNREFEQVAELCQAVHSDKKVVVFLRLDPDIAQTEVAQDRSFGEAEDGFQIRIPYLGWKSEADAAQDFKAQLLGALVAIEGQRKWNSEVAQLAEKAGLQAATNIKFLDEVLEEDEEFETHYVLRVLEPESEKLRNKIVDGIQQGLYSVGHGLIEDPGPLPGAPEDSMDFFIYPDGDIDPVKDSLIESLQELSLLHRSIIVLIEGEDDESIIYPEAFKGEFSWV